MSSLERFARRLERVERDVRNGATQPRLRYSSVDGGAITLKDAGGNIQGVIGQQWDGTTTAASVGGAPPPSPTAPLATPVPGGLALYWDGTYVDDSPTRMDFKRVTFHAVIDVDYFDALNPAQICGEITIATGGEVFASLPPIEHFIFAVAWTDAGKFSVESDVAFATPLSSASQEQWEEHDAKLAELNEVTLPALEQALGDNQTQIIEIRDTTLPALETELSAAQDAITQVQADTGTLSIELANLHGQVDQISSDTGDVANIVDIISKTTRSTHGIY